jgi:hypothetical protein
MVATFIPQLIGLAVCGIAFGLVALARGLLAYQRALDVATIATAPVTGLAAGEASVTGTVEYGPNHLRSPLQGVPCVHYHARIERHEGDSTRTVYASARSVSFRVRDESGSILVFPAGARWSVAERVRESAWGGGTPASVMMHADEPVVATARTRDEQIAELLTVHAPVRLERDDSPLTSAAGSILGGSLGGGRTEYREDRLEAGEVVTVTGTAVPFADVDELAVGSDPDLDEPLADPEIAADIASARAAGMLAPSAAAAWGNAMIPGFGIGRPIRPPELDPGVPRAGLPVDSVDDGGPGFSGGSRGGLESVGAPYGLAAGDLVLASIPGVPLRIMAGAPEQVESRERATFWQGLGGAVVAVASIGLLVLALTGGV